MLDFSNPDIIIGDGGLVNVVDWAPTFEDINLDLFPQGFFSQVAFDYLDDNWGNGYDMEDTVARWINDEDKEHWYDIKKTESRRTCAPPICLYIETSRRGGCVSPGWTEANATMRRA